MEDIANKVELQVIGMGYLKKASFLAKLFFNHESSYTVVLADKNSERKIQIIVNQLEAQGIAITVEKMTPARPLIEDIFKTTVELFNSKLENVIIHKLDDEGYLHSLMSFSGQSTAVNARPADSISMALRFECPIYIDKNIFEKLLIINA